MRITSILAALTICSGCAGGPDQYEADMAVCNAMMPTSLPTTEELVARGSAYIDAFFKNLTLARKQEEQCRERAILAAEHRDAARAAALGSLQDLGNGLQAAGASLSNRSLPVVMAQPSPPPPGVPLSSFDHIMSEAPKPELPPWCRPDSPFSHSSACPSP